MGSLTPLNTFGLGSTTDELIQIYSEDELIQASLQHPKIQQAKILGGGSNLILSEKVPGPVLQILIKGKSILTTAAAVSLNFSAGNSDGTVSSSQTRSNDSVNPSSKILVEASAGENWHEFVRWTLEQGAHGLENLSLIPGTVGASPIQNIGAYGVEVKDFIKEVHGYDLVLKKHFVFQNSECHFAYRDSVFKTPEQKHFVVTKVIFELNKISEASQAPLKVSYGDVQKWMTEHHLPLTPKGVAEAVIGLRQSKLPDPQKIGNAGSFFKNPIVNLQKKNELVLKFPKVPVYPSGDQFKISAGWLIDQAGWKGRRLGPVGVYEKQALVLVNLGGAHAPDVWKLAKAIQDDVLQKFDIALEPEPISW